MNKFSSAMSCYILAQRIVRSTWGSQSSTSCGFRSGLLSKIKFVCFGEMHKYFHSFSKISLLDVEERNCNSHNEEDSLKSAFHGEQFSSTVLSACKTIQYFMCYTRPQNSNHKSTVHMNKMLFNTTP